MARRALDRKRPIPRQCRGDGPLGRAGAACPGARLGNLPTSGRAHRIGQDKAVFVHKLVMLETIEEKMEALKATKRDLVAGIL